MTPLSFLKTKLADVFSPPACICCGDNVREHLTLCHLCYNRISSVPSFAMKITPTQDLMVYTVGAYQEPLKSLILAKRHGDYEASRQLGELIWSRTILPQLMCDYLVPVPLHWSRYADRGYNHAEIMAQQIAYHNEAHVVPALTRVRRTAYQAGLRMHDRHLNVQSAFALNTNYPLKDKHVVLIDDVALTGATVTEAARSLLHARPASITAVVACCVM